MCTDDYGTEADGFLFQKEVAPGYLHSVLLMEYGMGVEMVAAQGRHLTVVEMVEEGLTIVATLGGLGEKGEVDMCRPLSRRDLELLGVDTTQGFREPNMTGGDLISFWFKG